MTDKRSCLAIVALLLTLVSGACVSSSLDRQLQSTLESLLQKHRVVPGIVVTLESESLTLRWSGAAGVADLNSGAKMELASSLRLASTTKTYTAAAVLRLMETGELRLDDHLQQHLSESSSAILRADGYRPQDITLRHLLTHTAGLYDYADYDHHSYEKAIQADPQHRWSRDEQLRFAMRAGDPLGSPGEQYYYSDTGYILLGEIIERRTGLGLAQALRKLLSFSELGLNATWLESLEPRPATALPRISQYLGETNMRDWDPSLDLYGGGGLVSSMADLSSFYKALFEGQVFHQSGTLEMMKSRVVTSRSRPDWMQKGRNAYAYSMGMFISEYRGYTFFSHGGFWGTEGGYLPALGLAWGWGINQQDTMPLRKVIREALLDVVIDEFESRQQTRLKSCCSLTGSR